MHNVQRGTHFEEEVYLTFTRREHADGAYCYYVDNMLHVIMLIMAETDHGL